VFLSLSYIFAIYFAASLPFSMAYQNTVWSKKKKTLKYLQVPEYSYESSNQRLLLFHSDLLIPGSSIKNLSFKNMEQLERINYYGSSQHEVDFPSCLKDFLKLWK
jgi:hypothetical protein